MKEDGFLYYRDRVCVLNDDELKKSILEDAHSGSFAMHSSSTKMYQDLKTSYWWFGMKRDGRMEMRPNHNGFYGRVTSDRKKE